VLLDLKLLGIGNGGTDTVFDYFEHPGVDRVSAGEDLLSSLGFTQGGSLTEWGRLASDAPFHPRIVRALIEAKRMDAVEEVIPALIAILEGERLGVDFLEGVKKFRVQGFQTRIADRIRAWADKVSLAPLKSVPRPGEEKIARVILAGFHDRVGRRKANEPELPMANLGVSKIPY